MIDAPSFRCPACNAPPAPCPCACGDAIGTSFPLLACDACGETDGYFYCAACGAGGYFVDWLDPSTSTPALRRAADEGEVSLVASLKPRFPERCVVCLRARLTGTLVVKARAKTWASRFIYGWLVNLFVGRRVEVTAPACAPCVDRFDSRRRLRWLLTWGLAIATYVVARAAFDLDRGPARWTAVGAWCVGWLAGFVFVRPEIEVEVADDVATYTFAHEPYAVEFARLNDA